MMDPRIERRNGVWYMILGDEASPIDATVSASLNAKAARMVEALRKSEPIISAYKDALRL